MNSIAWTFYENIKDKNLLKKAASWAKKSVELENKAYNNDTYACLLYVLGDTTKAIQIEETAFKLAKNNNEKNLEDYIKTLEKMRAGEKLD